MEVPTIVSFSSLHGLVEQNVHIPVPHGRGGGEGLQGFRPELNSTAFSGAEHVDIPVPRRGGLQGLGPGQVSAASSSHSIGDENEAFTVGFSHFFPKSKKCEDLPHPGVRTGCGLYSMDAGSSCGPAAGYVEGRGGV